MLNTIGWMVIKSSWFPVETLIRETRQLMTLVETAEQTLAHLRVLPLGGANYDINRRFFSYPAW